MKRTMILAFAGLLACSDAPPPEAAPSAPAAVTSAAPAEAAAPTAAPASAPPAAPAAGCTFQTRTFTLVDGYPVQMITMGGRLFSFESNGAAWKTNGIDLTEIPSFAAGPCKGRAKGECKLDTHAFVPIGDQLSESITAYGAYFTFSGDSVGSTDLALLERYSTGGPCSGKKVGECTFDTRAFLYVGDHVVESITAGGNLYEYLEDGTAIPHDPSDLAKIERYQAACAGNAPCKFDTRVFEDVDGHLLETVTAYGKVFHWEASGPAEGSVVEPSNVPVSTIEPWASGVCGK